MLSSKCDLDLVGYCCNMTSLSEPEKAFTLVHTIFMKKAVTV